MPETARTQAPEPRCAFGVDCRGEVVVEVVLEVGTLNACQWHADANRWRTLGPDGLPLFAGRLCVRDGCSNEGRWREKDRPPHAPLMGTYCDFHWDQYVQVAS